MAFAIGLRIYKIEFRLKGKTDPISFSDLNAVFDPIEFVRTFVTDKATPTNETDEQRAWFLEAGKTPSIRTVHGLVRYGTHGFESRLLDSSTRKENYKRKSTDLEEVPLYFQFWMPSNRDFGMAAFQSFQGRSCVMMIMSAMKIMFEKMYPDYRMHYYKVVPIDAAKFLNAPVKSLRLVTKSMPTDKFDDYLQGKLVDVAEYEVVARAQRNGSFGILRDIKKPKEGETQALLYDGIEFEELKADVLVGGKRRTIGVMGSSNNAGVIELNDSVKCGADGHPIFESISREVDSLLSECAEMVKT